MGIAQDCAVMETAEVVTGVEAAEILGVDSSTVSRWSDDDLTPEARKLTAVYRLRGPRGYKLFRRTDVEALRDKLAAEKTEASA